jgi:signal transduction histidine kinase
MKKTNTFLFGSLLSLILLFLAGINFLKDSYYLNLLSDYFVPVISVVLIVFVTLLFIYREDENNKTLNQFITIITHKIKTPLTGIHWSINMLQKDLTLLEKKDLLSEMQKTNDRLMEIMDLLVSFVRFESKTEPIFEVVSFLDIVQSSYEKNLVAIKNKNIQFSIEKPSELLSVCVDKIKIQFAVDMIVDNAIKYTPANGHVEISFDIEDKNFVLKISDSGIGISVIDSKKIFSHFFRAENAKRVDSGGLGLGLYAARKIVENNKGKLWVESRGLNKGSTFYLKLPIKK